MCRNRQQLLAVISGQSGIVQDEEAAGAASSNLQMRARLALLHGPPFPRAAALMTALWPAEDVEEMGLLAGCCTSKSLLTKNRLSQLTVRVQ